MFADRRILNTLDQYSTVSEATIVWTVSTTDSAQANQKPCGANRGHKRHSLVSSRSKTSTRHRTSPVMEQSASGLTLIDSNRRPTTRRGLAATQSTRAQHCRVARYSARPAWRPYKSGHATASRSFEYSARYETHLISDIIAHV